MADHESGNWERSVLEKLAYSALQEQKRTRHWGIFFKLLTFAYLFVLLFIAIGTLHPGGGELRSGAKHTALITIEGVIGNHKQADADTVINGLQAAFKDKNTQAIILRINSPGGSPVHAGQINAEIKRLRAKNPKIPLYAVVNDICASGGYYIAVAADKIYVDKASLVGSIGVVMDGFGFTGAMEKLGVERRALTAGENKGFLDPFAPVNPAHLDHAKSMLGEIHKQFIQVVRDGRGKRLKESSDTFSGLIWTGEKAVELGLVDAIGSTDYVAREIIKNEDLVDFTPHEGLADRLAKRFGTAFGAGAAQVFGSQFGLK